MTSQARRALGVVLGVGAMLTLPSTSEAAVELRGALEREGLWCFPSSAQEPSTFLYLPSRARLAQDSNGTEAFSLLRYVEAAEPEHSPQSVTEARGGAVLHFLATYDTPRDQIERAQRALRRDPGHRDASLTGPVVLEKASYTVVSSTLRQGRSQQDWEWLASGSAPVLEGGRIALSFELSPERSRLLLESLKTPTSDVSVVFDLTFKARSPAYDARLVVDWSRVHDQRGFSAGASYAFVGAEVETLFDQMLDNGAIRLESAGEDAASEALLERVYARLLDLMFTPVEQEEVDDGARGGLLDALSVLISDPTTASREVLGYGASIGYRLKQLATEGHSVLTFSHQATLERHQLLTVNLGDLYARYGDDSRHFRTVSLDDPTYRQRDVRVTVDGALAPEFDRLLNHVEVRLRKRHGSGVETLRELVVQGATFEQDAPDLTLTYGWDGDRDLSAWLEYDLELRWSFEGGRNYVVPWQTRSDAVIVLDAPYVREDLMVLGDSRALEKAGVRAVTVAVATSFFGEQRRQQRVYRIDGQPIDDRIGLVQPRGERHYHYRVVWTLASGETRTREARDDRGALFVDELPPPNATDVRAGGTSSASND